MVGSTFVTIKSHKKAVPFSHWSMQRYTVNLPVEIHTMYTQLVAQVLLFSEFGTKECCNLKHKPTYSHNPIQNLSLMGEISSPPRKQMVYTHCSKENVMLELLFHGHNIMHHKLIPEKQYVNHFWFWDNAVVKLRSPFIRICTMWLSNLWKLTL